MNIAIVGCGYVGYAVAKYWKQNSDLVITATTTTPAKVSALQEVAQKVEVVESSDIKALKSVLKNQDVVLLSVGAKSRDSYEESYLKTAENIVSVLQDNPTVKQLIYTASFSVYGDINAATVDEETPTAPSNANTKILDKAEQILLCASRENLRVCILRLAGIYGEARELVKIFSRAFGETRPGNGETITNWIHLDDIVGAIEFARQQQLDGIYNVVDDARVTSKELIDNLCEKYNKPQVNWDASQTKTRGYNFKVSNQKIKQAGYELIHPQMIF
ncbi:NAD dependent epimerase/dehydratase family protein [Rivularia sp. PCC 7116]|uniref:SDR family oxidoreductase n=1 Tax=Rivularia sp. PCC 7116 TaxID=373994 RepID=UPI00029F452B|nr:SDR family oxidoreductase [Rivularia sp. PCC 7116]AFY54759.1 NAD dependent epimerase/dehydratase family protein [Rivularia sp. PCC 7116]